MNILILHIMEVDIYAYVKRTLVLLVLE